MEKIRPPLVILKIICYNINMDKEKYLDVIKNTHRERYEKFAELLLDYNNICNLTSVTDEKGVTYKHFYDSIEIGRAHV